MVERSKKKVVITGITGFLGSQVCDSFLKDGSFEVRGTVRDKNNEKKLAPLKKAFGDNYNKLELAEADLLKPESVDEAIKGCDYVVHTASPFPLSFPDDENVLIKPAVEGTLAALRAAHKYKVKRVVVTSSIAAIYARKPEDMKDVLNESDWSDPSAADDYEKSKTLAEKAAWDYVLNLPESERFELIVINPALIFGPSLITGDFSSATLISDILRCKYPGTPKIMMPIVDVRDVAHAHLQALKIDEAKNQRFILSSQCVWFKKVSEILQLQYPRQGIKTPELCYCAIKMTSWFDKSVKLILPYWEKTRELDNTKSKEILKIEYYDVKESILAMAESLISSGQVILKR